MSMNLLQGTVDVLGIGSFDDPLSLRITGATTIGRAVEIEFEGPTTAVPNPPPLDVARTCVAADARIP